MITTVAQWQGPCDVDASLFAEFIDKWNSSSGGLAKNLPDASLQETSNFCLVKKLVKELPIKIIWAASYPGK
ncbi:unnamed protein product, partial [Musa hybrid cultivar]